MQSRRIVVVGAGVVGLTTARALEEAGHDVRVVAERSGLDESSGAAGAVWFLYGAELGSGSTAERANVLARATWRWLAELARDAPEAGVRVVDAWQVEDADVPPSWAASVPEEAGLAWVGPEAIPAPLQVEVAGRPPAGAWRFRAPVVEPARHLAWLERGLAHPVERARVADLAALDADLVVNATGHLAERLVDDPALEPRLGRVAVATAGRLPRDEVLMDDRDPGVLVYAIPRGPAGAEVVLGGVDRPRAGGLTLASDPAELEAVLARHRARGVVPEGPVVERAGWRPGRRGGPRIEREGRVIHAYGHGGAGFTLARGTALEVVALAASQANRSSVG